MKFRTVQWTNGMLFLQRWAWPHHSNTCRNVFIVTRALKPKEFFDQQQPSKSSGFHRVQLSLFRPQASLNYICISAQVHRRCGVTVSSDSHGYKPRVLAKEIISHCRRNQIQSFGKYCFISHFAKPSYNPSSNFFFQGDIHNQSRGNSRGSHSRMSFSEVLSTCLALILSAVALLLLHEQEIFPLPLKVGQCASVELEARRSKLKFVKSDSASKKSPLCLQSKSEINGNSKNGRLSIPVEVAVKKTQLLCERRKEELSTPGLGICVSVDGSQVYAEGFGYADLENETPLKPNTVFRIASISKSIATVILAKLWEDKKVDLEKTVQDYVPDFPQKYFMGEKVDITVKHVLSHTSGIRHYKKDNDPVSELDQPIQRLVDLTKAASLSPFYKVGPGSKPSQKEEERPPPEAEKKKRKKRSKSKFDKEAFSQKLYSSTTDALGMFKDDPLVSKPGTKFYYTTHGFTLVAAVIESASGKKYSDLVSQSLAHWGLGQSYLDQHRPIIYNRARFYMKNDEGHIVNTPYVDSSYKWAGGGLLSTVEDITKFGNILLYSAQHEEGDPGPPGYLKASTVWKFWTSPGAVPRYGLGFELQPEMKQYGLCGHHTFGAGHTGNAVGCSSVIFILPRGSVSECDANGSNINNSCSDKRCENDKSSENSNTTEDNSSIKHKFGATRENKERGLPQGVVVTAFVNIPSVDLRKLAQEVARIWENVDFTL